jgi:1,4-dihydroxy-2-naphthoate octaprenyltransferase
MSSCASRDMAVSSAARNIIRALRLPFVAASILPFLAGSLLAGKGINLMRLFLGLSAVIYTHLGANLLNDYADSKSGADSKDARYFGFFGGSKLIQEGILKESFCLNTGLFFLASAVSSIFVLASLMKSESILWYSALAVILAVSYSCKPFQLSYRRMGEAVVFILFGPAAVMGGYFIQTGVFPDMRAFILSLPFGFLTTAILFANEVPDFADDRNSGKYTLVSISGPYNAFIFYGALVAMAFVSISANIIFGVISPVAIASFFFIFMPLRAFKTIRQFPQDKIRLLESSGLTIALQGILGVILIMGVLCRRS